MRGMTFRVATFVALSAGCLGGPDPGEDVDWHREAVSTTRPALYGTAADCVAGVGGTCGCPEIANCWVTSAECDSDCTGYCIYEHESDPYSIDMFFCGVGSDGTCGCDDFGLISENCSTQCGGSCIYECSAQPGPVSH